MYMDYTKLWKMLIDKGITKTDLAELAGLSSRVVAKLTKNQTVTTDTLARICEVLGCDVGEIMTCVDDVTQSLYQCFKKFGKPVEQSDGYKAISFPYRGQNFLVYVSKKTANKATHIHCKRDGTICWEQLYPFGGVATPGREETVLVRPIATKEQTVLVVIKGAPAIVIGRDENGFVSAGQKQKKSTDIYVMTEAEFKLFSVVSDDKD